MENTKLIIGRHCMEQSEIVLSQCSKYTLVTTDLVAAQSQCIYSKSIKSIKFSSNEMFQFCSFFSENANLQKLGFAESSVLFVAIRERIMVAVTDEIMESICKEMGIEILKIEKYCSNRSKMDKRGKDLRPSQTSRLCDFIRAACL